MHTFDWTVGSLDALSLVEDWLSWGTLTSLHAVGAAERLRIIARG